MGGNETYHVIGLMSGSSLDGLDICYVRFKNYDLGFTYEILQADCISYDAEFKNKLRNIAGGTAFELAQLHTELGKYFGKLTKDFIDKNKIEDLDLVVSHGQTIFHQPQKGFTTQIGCGAQIAALTNCKTVCDLRTSDLAYGGQGAPIVPIAENELFPDFKMFLNIGGIANIAFHDEDKITAYDVCAANTLLNHFAQQAGKDFDEDGLLARDGKINESLLEELTAISFYEQHPPRSLGTEHIVQDWLPLFDKYDISIEDKLCTAVEHIAIIVGREVDGRQSTVDSGLLITGGGALNTFQVERIQHHSPVKTVVPDDNTIKYKEALAMALIGLLRELELPNTLSSVTGASKNTIGGAVYLP